MSYCSSLERHDLSSGITLVIHALSAEFLEHALRFTPIFACQPSDRRQSFIRHR